MLGILRLTSVAIDENTDCGSCLFGGLANGQVTVRAQPKCLAITCRFPMTFDEYDSDAQTIRIHFGGSYPMQIETTRTDINTEVPITAILTLDMTRTYSLSQIDEETLNLMIQFIMQ